MDLSEKLTVSASPDVVWDFLHDHHAVVACIPGAQLGDPIGSDGYNGTMAVSFGPKRLTFRGTANYTFDEVTRTCQLTAKGADGGATRAAADLRLAASGATDAPEPDGSVLALDITIRVIGPLQGFVETGGVKIAQQLLGQFATELEAALQAKQSNSSPPSEAATLRPARLLVVVLWTSIREKARSVFRRDRRNTGND